MTPNLTPYQSALLRCSNFAPMLGDIPNNIDAVIEWTRTSRGGKQFDLLQAIARAETEEVGLMCESAFGLCE